MLRSRLPFIVLAMANLVIGLWSGLIRIGWSMPQSTIAVHHGAIMIGGFFTTLIALEKVIPMKRKLAFVVPVLSALTLTMTIDGYYKLGLFLLIAGGVGLMIIQCWYLFKYPGDRSVTLMVIGAGCLVVADVLLLGKRFYPACFPWWMGFILFTIVGERLELSRFLPVSRNAKTALYCFLALFIVGLLLPFHTTGKYVSGISLITVACWLLRYDMIKIGLRANGLTKYAAVSLLLGNISLIMEGILLIFIQDAVFGYDILVHTFFIGFGFTMVFAHGPIILPAVLGIGDKPFTPLLYLWLLVLQSSLYLRIFSDVMVDLEWRKYSGLLTVAGIVFYFITIAVLVVARKRRI